MKEQILLTDGFVFVEKYTSWFRPCGVEITLNYAKTILQGLLYYYCSEFVLHEGEMTQFFISCIGNTIFPSYLSLVDLCA